MKKRTLTELNKETGPIANLARAKRKQLGYTQSELAKRIGVGLRFLKAVEQGEWSLQLDKVELVLHYFGCEIAPVLKKKTLLPFDETNQ